MLVVPSLLTFDVAGPAGRLEAQLDLPDGPPRGAALLCHPHPLHGGTMHTHAVFRAMRALRARGHAVLRFNFRGVGRSEGTHGAGAGEREDARAALDALRRRYSSVPVICGGFSFGAWVGLAVGAQERADGLLGLGLPCRLYSLPELAETTRPTALVQAERDDFCSSPEIRALVTHLTQPARLWIVPGTTHLFTEALGAYEDVVGEAADWLALTAGALSS